MSFIWGAATSSHQVEGNNQFNDWWQWELEGKIDGAVRSGLATDHWNRFHDDLALAKSLSLNSYRFSIEWSRIRPTADTWNDSALDWYVNLVDECDRLGIIPMATLHHFTLPQWVAEKGGLLWDGLADAFLEYVDRVAKRLGSRVPLWCTVNEPMVLTVGGYLGSFMPPGVNRPEKIGEVSHNLLHCHVLAYDRLHQHAKDRTGRWKEMPLSVGIAHNMMDFVSARKWHPFELGMAKVISRFYNQAWLDAITGRAQHFSVSGLLPKGVPFTPALKRSTADFIGVNYYTKCYIRWGISNPPIPGRVAISKSDLLPIEIYFADIGETKSQLDWAIHPKGFGRMLQLAARYKLPIYVTENGIADPSDNLRQPYLKEHLLELARMIRKGVDIRGYYYWSLTDNFEWSKGFEPRFGLADIDYKTFARKVRPSGLLYKKIVEGHNGKKPSVETIVKSY